MSATQQPIRVLLVEDNPGDARLILEHLRRCGEDPYPTTLATSVAAAEEHLASEPHPDVILLDLSLPDSSGLATVERVIRAAPKVPIIVLTESADDRLPMEALRAGANDYLLKEEVSERVLPRVIAYAIERAERESERMQVEAALRESDARFRLVLGNSPIIMSTTDRDLRYTWLYNAHPSWKAKDALGKRDDELSPPEHTSELVALKRRVVESGEGERREIRIRVDGNLHHYDVTAEPFHDPAGGVAGVRVAAVDITEIKRKKIQSEFLAGVGSVLAASLDRDEMLQSVIEHIVPGLADWCVINVVSEGDENDTMYLNANDPRKLEILEAMLARYPHGARPESDPVGRVLHGGKSVLVELVTPEMLEQLAMDEVQLEMLRELAPLSSMIVPMIARGKVSGTITITTAESGRRYDTADLALAEELGRRAALAFENARLYRVEQRAREYANRLQRVTAALSEAATPETVAEVVARQGLAALGASVARVAMLSEAGTTLELVSEAAFGDGAAASMRSFPIDAALPLAEAVRNGDLVTAVGEEINARFPDLEDEGWPRCHAWAAAPLLLDGESIGAISFGFDATPHDQEALGQLLLSIGRESAHAMGRALLYQRERRAVRARDEVLGVVAHDLRNPLAAVGMYAHLLSEPAIPDDRRLLHARAIDSLIRKMDRLIEDLLDVSRMEGGRLRMEPAPMNIVTALRDAAIAMEKNATAAGIGLTVEEGPDLPPVLADRDRILQVFSNLIGNALRFTPQGGHVVLSAGFGGSGIEVSVKDTGHGIDQEHIPHIFDRFWQAPSGRRNGAGLGLPIVKGIIEAHGGQVRVESVLGEGSTFFFTLPVAPLGVSWTLGSQTVTATDSPAVPLDDRGTPGPGSSRRLDFPEGDPLRVLLVDDHAAIRRGARTILEANRDIEVVGEVGTGEEAVEAADRLKPDVILMDLQLPGLNGIEAIHRIHATNPRIRVIALTADPKEKSLLKVLQAGGTGFISKVHAHDDLLPALAAIARNDLVLPDGGAELLLEGFRTGSGCSDTLSDLSIQDQQIIRYVAEGFTSREIGRKLFLSPHTVDSYRSTLMKRLQLNHRSDLVRFALRTGLLESQEGSDSADPVISSPASADVQASEPDRSG
jgi:PAS domain S-box-containing protein